MDTKGITFDKLPEAVGYLIGKVESLEQAFLQMKSEPEQPTDNWFDVDGLMEYLPDKPAKPTVYGWVSSRQIPHHKGGKKLRFRQSEIDEWLSSGKRLSESEMESAASEYLTKKAERRHE